MKRELKARICPSERPGFRQNRKAHPDEKGTESLRDLFFNESGSYYRKAHPDEKGTESS